MKKIFNINEEERSRILNLHEKAAKSHYVNLINEVAAFGAKYPQTENVLLYTKVAGGEGVSTTLPIGTVWTFDGNKATTKTAKGTTITYRCDRPAGGVTKGVTFNFTNGSVGLYTQTGNLDATLKKTFCEASSKPKTDTVPPPSSAGIPYKIGGWPTGPETPEEGAATPDAGVATPVNTNKPNAQVKQLQQKLNSLPNVVSVIGSKLSEDGVFGAKTLEAALVALRGSSPESIKSKVVTSVPTGQTKPETLASRT